MKVDIIILGVRSQQGLIEKEKRDIDDRWWEKYPN